MTLIEDNVGKRYKYCDSCEALLPEPGMFCVQCMIPEAADPNPQKDISFSQACSRISLLIIIFVLIVFYKMEINPLKFFKNLDTNNVPHKMPEDEDYKIYFNVNTGFAKVRDKPNSKTSTTLFVLTKGTQVEVLEKKGEWSRIRSKKNAGKKVLTGWLVSNLLDSEIK